MINLTINDKTIEVPEGTTVLRAAEMAGITIPTLCDHPDLTPYGGCRLCVVEIQGARIPMTACTLQVSQGMVVQTETPALAQSRRAILELLLSNYFDAGYGEWGYSSDECKETQFVHWVKQSGIDMKAAMAKKPRYPVNSDPNPFIWVDLNKCIICTRCIRACAEVQGRFVWNLAERGDHTHIVAGADTHMIDARCESCGACAAYCPTGALDHKMFLNLGFSDKVVTTTCTYCGVGCQLDLNIKNNKIIVLTSNPKSPVNGMALCVKGRYGFDFIHHPDRLTKPKIRRYLLEGKPKPNHQTGWAFSSTIKDQPFEWVEVDWDIALDITASKLREIRDTYGSNSIGVLSSAKCLNEENYLMNKFARQVVGTNSIDHCARL